MGSAPETRLPIICVTVVVSSSSISSTISVGIIIFISSVSVSIGISIISSGCQWGILESQWVPGPDPGQNVCDNSGSQHKVFVCYKDH